MSSPTALLKYHGDEEKKIHAIEEGEGTIDADIDQVLPPLSNSGRGTKSIKSQKM